MALTTNISSFIDANCEGNWLTDIRDCYDAILDRVSVGPFSVSTRADKTFVVGPSSGIKLLSEAARRECLRQIDLLKDEDEDWDDLVLQQHLAMRD